MLPFLFMFALLALRLALLPFMLPLPFVVVMPAVFVLPLLLVTTAVFEGTVLPLVFAGMLAFVSTMPFRLTPFVFEVALVFKLVLLALVFAFVFVLSQPTDNAASAIAATNAASLLFSWSLPDKFHKIKFKIFTESCASLIRLSFAASHYINARPYFRQARPYAYNTSISINGSIYARLMPAKISLSANGGGYYIDLRKERKVPFTTKL